MSGPLHKAHDIWYLHWHSLIISQTSRLLTIITLSQDCRCGALKLSRILPYVIIMVFMQQFLSGCVLTTSPYTWQILIILTQLWSITPCFCFTLECFYQKAHTWMETSNKTHFYNFCYFTSLASFHCLNEGPWDGFSVNNSCTEGFHRKQTLIKWHFVVIYKLRKCWSAIIETNHQTWPLIFQSFWTGRDLWK